MTSLVSLGENLVLVPGTGTGTEYELHETRKKIFQISEYPSSNCDTEIAGTGNKFIQSEHFYTHVVMGKSSLYPLV